MSHIALPSPDLAILQRRTDILKQLKKVAPGAILIADQEGRRTFETDALTAYRCLPLAVVLPDTTEEVSAILRFCHENHLKVVPRGAGTSLSGGALPLEDALVLCLSRMNKVLAVDLTNRVAQVEAGVTNSAITEAVAGAGYFYAPDPSSQIACTIGGNVATNSGGAHCLKYGVTTNNVLGVRIVLMNGEIVDIGGPSLDPPGYDFLALIIGSEGQLGIVTEVTVRLLKAAEGTRPMLLGFESNEFAGACVAAIIAAGVVPVALEFMDRPAIHVCEHFIAAGYPLDAEALLIVEVQGSEDEIDTLLEKIGEIARDFNPMMMRRSGSAEESAKIWKGRKAAFGAIGQLSDYYCMDGVIPLSKLPKALDEIGWICRRYRFDVANIFHAGDGNLHPLILYNANDPIQLERVELCGAEILKLCVELGGCLTGEHGVGIEKRELMRVQFSEADIAQQMRVKLAFDPDWLLNPGKVFPLEGIGLPVTGHMRVGFHAPDTVEELAYLVAEAADTRTPLEVMGRGTKREVGRPVQYGAVLSTESLVGIPLYEPSELVVVAMAGTPIGQIEQALAENDQEFPFEPIDLGPVLGFGPGQGTIGGVVATNFSGSRRIFSGSARDHVLGVQAVNGRGETIRAGGRVMKNVTGYDLSRALAGSWGTLAVMTEIAIKVLPAQREARTVLCFGLADQNGIEALCLAVGTPFEVSGTVHMHAELAERLSDQEIANAGASVTAIRVENFPASARYRSSRLKQMLQAYAPALELDTLRSRAFWDEVRTLKMFQKADRPLWRISTVPSTAAKLVHNLARKMDVRVLYDWSGGLVWLETPPISDAGAVEIRRNLAEIGGHATLIRAEASARAAIDVFQPLDKPVMALTESLKRAFDPVGILNPGRMYPGI